jgi:uncharacterized membrane protein YdfJ with MMPL/SSD domain
MQSVMNRLSAFVRRRRKLVAIAWLVLLLASIPFASRQTENLTGGGFEAPGTGSAEVDHLVERFQGASSESLGVVLQRKGGDAAAVQAEVDQVDKAAAKVDHIELTADAAAAAKSDATKGAVVIMPLALTGSREQALDAAVDLRDELGVDAVHDGVQPYVVGQQALWAGMQKLQKEDLEKAEFTGFPAILIVLLAVFGSALAALLPAGLGIAAVILTGAAVYFLALATTMSVFVTNVASMLGIGVAVDYSLFLLSRYRDELANGHDRDEALDIAMRTSGAVVVFSGMTVVVSLAGLFLLDSTVMRSMAIGAIVVVAIAIVGAITLLPALIALLGRRADERGRVVSATGALVRRVTRRKTAAERGVAPGAFWKRWTDRVMALFAALAAGFLLLLAVPALSLNFGNGALAQFPKGYETRVGAELAGQQVAPGASAPTIVVADFRKGAVDDPENKAALDRYAEGLKQTGTIAQVSAPVTSTDGHAALLNVVLKRDPESPQSLHFIGVLRSEGGRASGLDKLAKVSIGGSTAQTRDFTHLISGGLWKVFAFVMICSYLVLLVVLRSVLLPLKAVLMNLLSVGAAYGVLVAIFQYGWLDGITGYNSLGYINAVTPPLLLAIVFGLSMDYEVFLLSRIRERYLATGDNRLAVSEGLQASAKTITSAAVIMVVVFGVFALTGVPQIKEIGAGLAVAIGLDASIVRLILVPATMELMGKWNWWMPGWLGRILPEADFESDHVVEDERAPAVV